MKKITLLLILFAFTTFGYAQYLSEGFETSIPPSGWTLNSTNSGAYTWSLATVNPHSGTYSAQVQYDPALSPQNESLVSPIIDLTSATDPQLTFWFNMSYYWSVDPETNYDFVVSITDGTTTTPLWDQTDFGVFTNFVWYEVSLDLSAYVGTNNMQLIFSYVGVDGASLDIDDVLVAERPAEPLCATNPFPADGAIDIAYDNITLTWSAPATGPTPTSYNVYGYDDVLGTNPFLIVNVATTSVDVTVGAFGVDIFWAAIPVNISTEATGCDIWSFTTEDLPPPPVNDACSGAIVLTPGTTFDVNPLVGSTNGATGSGALPLPGCAEYDPADPTGFGGDVWYSVVVPADGNLTVETNGNPTGGAGDSGMAVYSGACGALVLVECDDDDSPDGTFSQVVIEPTDGLANQTIYLRVWEYGGNDPMTFQISAHSLTLSSSDFEDVNNFTYYPNPVKNTLQMNAQSSIQNVSIFNMLGQEVLRTAPNNVNSTLDMSALQTGAYFVKVTINDRTETVRVIKQ